MAVLSIKPVRDNVGPVRSTGVLSAVLNGNPEVFGNSVVIPGFSALHCPSKCSSCPFYVCRRTYSNVSCQLGIIPGSGRRHGQETRSNRPIPSYERKRGSVKGRERNALCSISLHAILQFRHRSGLSDFTRSV